MIFLGFVWSLLWIEHACNIHLIIWMVTITTFMTQPGHAAQWVECWNYVIVSLYWFSYCQLLVKINTHKACDRLTSTHTSTATSITPALLSTFIENFRRIPELKWQYYASEEGYSTFYPTFHFADALTTCGTYDPRYRYSEGRCEQKTWGVCGNVCILVCVYKYVPVSNGSYKELTGKPHTNKVCRCCLDKSYIGMFTMWCIYLLRF